METKIFTLALTVFCIIAAIFIFKQGFRNSLLSEKHQRNKLICIVLGILGWILFISTLALTDFIQDWNSFPPKIFLTVLLPALASVLFTIFSGSADQLIKGIDGRFLVYIQSFRILVEILLWMMLKEGLIPVQMSFEGRNFDILVGLTAPLAGYFIYRNPFMINRPLLLCWNLFGLGLLLNIVTLAILSTPVSFRVFMNEPSNTIIARFPGVFIPGVFVVLAYTMHFMSIRKWYIEK